MQKPRWINADHIINPRFYDAQRIEVDRHIILSLLYKQLIQSLHKMYNYNAMIAKSFQIGGNNPTLVTKGDFYFTAYADEKEARTIRHNSLTGSSTKYATAYEAY